MLYFRVHSFLARILMLISLVLFWDTSMLKSELLCNLFLFHRNHTFNSTNDKWPILFVEPILMALHNGNFLHKSSNVLSNAIFQRTFNSWFRKILSLKTFKESFALIFEWEVIWMAFWMSLFDFHKGRKDYFRTFVACNYYEPNIK